MWLAAIGLGASKIWLDRNVDCTLFAAGVLLTIARLMRVPWTVRRSNQSILKGITPEYSLEGLMLRLQYFGLLK